MKKLLVIGGTGNISYSVSKYAAMNGYDVTVFNRGSNRRLEKYGVQYIIGDYFDSEAFQSALAGQQFDIVANFLGFEAKRLKEDVDLFNGHIKQYIFISSVTVYQKPLYYHVITEDTPLKNNVDEYANKKIECELLLQECYRKLDFPVTILRPGHTYGETKLVLPITMWWESHWTWADRILKGQKIILFNEGKTLWSVMHSDDFAAACVGLMGDIRTFGHAINIASDETASWNYYMEVLGDALGRRPEIIYLPSDYIEERTVPAIIHGDKSESTIIDTSKLKRFVPGFSCKIPYRIGIEKSIDYFRSHPELMAVDEAYNAKLDKMIEDYQNGCGRG